MAASALGSLLRKAQEDRQKGAHLIPQSAQAESPIRQQIQGPITAPESVGSEKVVSLKGEMQPIQEGSTMAPGVAGIDNPSVVPPIIPPVVSMEGGVPAAVSPQAIASAVQPSGIASSLLPSSMKPGAVAQGNVLGASSPNFSAARNYSAAGSRTTGKLTADPLGLVQAQGKIGPSDPQFQSAQTPKQNIFGGIGKVGTAITSALGLPQLLPGGAFQKLQDKMAPTIKKWLPNFNKGRA